MSNALDVATAYVRRGWCVVPVGFREKRPHDTGWQTLRLTEAELPTYFNGELQNVGVLLGTASHGLVDVDLDCGEARSLASEFLLNTVQFGRASAPRSHWLYTCADLPGNRETFTDPAASGDEAMLLELRGSGHQTVFPGSTHAEGELIEWAGDGQQPLAALTARELSSSLRRLAAASLLLRHWAGGTRDGVALALAGCLLRAGWSTEDAVDFIGKVASAAGDEELRDRLKAQRVEKWEHKYGLPKLREVLDPAVVERLADWLELRPRELNEEQLLAELNSKYATMWDGPKLRILHETYDPTLKYNVVGLVERTHLKAFFENRPPVPVIGDNKTKHVNQIDWWMRQPKRRECKGIVLDPTRSDPDVYNLWAGWAFEPDPSGSCDLYLAHVHDNIANGDEKIAAYLLDWMADAVQHPTDRPGVAVVLPGGQGTGKGVYVRSFGELYGRHFAHVQSSEHFLGRFNKHLQHSLLLFADEAVWAGDKRAEGKLKGLITEPEVMIEAKFVDARRMPNNLRVFVASNHEWVVPAGLDERRMFVLDVGDKRQQDAGYFAAIREQLAAGGYGKLLHLLQTRDLSAANLRKFPPTPALLEQKIASMDGEARFLFDALKSGVLPGDYNGHGRSAKAVLHKRYLSFAKDSGLKFRPSKEQFAIALKRLVPELRTHKPHSGGREWEFPALAGVRERFAVLLRQPVVWEEPQEWQRDDPPWAEQPEM